MESWKWDGQLGILGLLVSKILIVASERNEEIRCSGHLGLGWTN